MSTATASTQTRTTRTRSTAQSKCRQCHKDGIILDDHIRSRADYDGEDKEYLRAVKDAARAKALRAKFEEWEASVGEDGGYINLTDENGCALETASKLKNRSDKNILMTKGSGFI